MVRQVAADPWRPAAAQASVAFRRGAEAPRAEALQAEALQAEALRALRAEALRAEALRAEALRAERELEQGVLPVQGARRPSTAIRLGP